MAYPERIVVTGAGLAGLRTVVSLREKGYTGGITLLGAEERAPYDRPPLSKKVLTEGVDPSLAADFGELEVDFRPGTEAVSLEASSRTVLTASGPVPYDALVIATGATPVTLPGSGKQRVLRTYDDALTLRGLLRPGLRLAIIGAGWIGAELATAAATAGASVTVVEAAPTPLSAIFGPEIGSVFGSWYAEAGVTLRTGAAVSSISDGGLALAGGDWLPADEIVTAVGVRPAVGWLAGSGLALDNGVAVDAGLRASLPDVYAVGDCASFPSGLFGARLRVEHWDSALHAPEVAAANILGGTEVYDPVPYFWSDQFGRMAQYVGHHGPDDQLVWRGDPAEPKWTACWLTPASDEADGSGGPGRVTALLTVGRPRDMVQARKLIAARAALDPARVADPAVPLKNAVA
jgi:NADPH-dependent 2,4-dienoyl-CoA reductase/sulfur reductase-like enzyme